jgi:hypothetical protein
VALVRYDPADQNIIAWGPQSGAIGLIQSLKSLNMEQLNRVFTTAMDAERTMFVIRGAAAHELVSRQVKKFTKEKGQGIDTLMRELAKDTGVDGRTLYKDYLIFEEFGAFLTNLLATNHERIMPREYYALAVNVSVSVPITPMDVAEYFEEKRQATGGYFTDHARRDIKQLNQGASIEEVSTADSVERMDAVNNPKERKQAVAQEKMIPLKVVASPQMFWLIERIVETHGSVGNYLTRRGTEEFGERPRGGK